MDRRRGPRDPSCVFCGIVEGRIPSAKVREDATTLAFMNIAPATEGHLLVIPKRHSRNVFDVSDEDIRDVAAATRAVSRLLRERLGCAGVSVIQSNEPAAWQTVFHYHVHVVPRYPGDPLVVPFRGETRGAAELERVAAKLRG